MHLKCSQILILDSVSDLLKSSGDLNLSLFFFFFPVTVMPGGLFPTFLVIFVMLPIRLI